MSADKRCPECGAVIPRGSENGLCVQCLFALGLDEFGAPAATAPSFAPLSAKAVPTSGVKFPHLGDYALLGEIAHGAMGIVFRARHLTLNRLVALKLISAGTLATEEMVKRFKAEAEAAASLSHPNIVSIYEIGEHQGQHYFSMALIEGPNLRDALALGRSGRENARIPNQKSAKSPHVGSYNLREAAQLVSTVSRAVHYAHQRGVLHRDIKPSNILLDVKGEPHLTDFGLAKLIEKESTLTHTNAVLGTPAYMAPEQARGQTKEVTTAADVYGLGAVLYETLTGCPPFGGGTSMETIRQVIDQEPRRPSLFNPSVDRDLETICLKCLEKEPERRYSSAAGLAADLDRWLRHEPISARRAGTGERLRKWVHRRPTLAALGALSIVSLLALAIGSTVAAFRIAASQRAEIEQHKAAVSAATVLRQSLYAADMNLVHQAHAAGNLGLARRLLSAHVPGPGQTDLRGFEWSYYQTRCRGDQRDAFTGLSNSIKAVAFSPDGTKIAAGSYVQGIRIWNLRDRTLETCIDEGGVEDLQFSPDGRWLAYCTGTGSLTFRELKTGRTVPLVAGGVARMALAPQGTLVAFSKGTNDAGGIIQSAADRTVEVWDYETRHTVFTASLPSYSLSFSTDGRMLGIVNGDNCVRVWRIAEGVLAGTFGPVSVRSPLSFSPDGSRLAAGDDAGELRIWDLSDGRLVRNVRAHDATIWDLCYSTNFLVTASTDQTLRVWDAASLVERAVLRGHGSEVWSVAISPDAALLASGDKEGSVRTWDLRQPPGALVPSRNVTFWEWPVFSEDGAFFAVGESKGVSIRRTDDGNLVQTLAKAHRPIAFTSHGRELITLGPSGTLQYWNWASEPRQPMVSISAGLTGIRTHAMRSRPDLLVLGDQGGNIRVWNLPQRSELRSWKGHVGQITSLAIAPDGVCLASSSVESQGGLKLWNLSDGTLQADLVGHRLSVFGVAFSADGRLLASASADDTCRLWNPNDGQEITALVGHKGGAFSVAFSADGQTLLVGTGDSRVKLWNLATFRDMGAIRVEPVSVFFTGFVPGRPTLATVSFDGPRTCSLGLRSARPAEAEVVSSPSLQK